MHRLENTIVTCPYYDVARCVHHKSFHNTVYYIPLPMHADINVTQLADNRPGMLYRSIHLVSQQLSEGNTQTYHFTLDLARVGLRHSET